MRHKRNIKIGLVAAEQEKINTCLRLVNDPQVEVCAFRSLKQLRSEKDLLPTLSGLVLDLETTLSASTQEKDFIRELRRFSKFPVLETALPQNAQSEGPHSNILPKLRSFLELAESYAAKETNKRVHPRHTRVVKVRILSSLQSGSPVTKAITADISEGGCFIVSFHDWSNVEEVFIEFNDSGVIIPSQIAWKRTWEQSANKFPGFGAQFLNLDEKSRAEIERMLAN